MKLSDQMPLPLPRTLDQQVEDALKRMAASLNRSVGQHLRAMRAQSARYVL